MRNQQLKTSLGDWAQTALGIYGYSFSEEINTKEVKSTQVKTVEVAEKEKHSTEKDETVNAQEVNKLLKSEFEPELEVEANDFELPDSTQLSDEVHDLAPDDLKPLLETFTGREKDIVLLSCITTLSSIFPRVSTVYRRKKFNPNLYSFIIGNAASGKGNLLTGKRIIEDLLNEIEKKNQYFYISANISSTKMIEKLSKTGDQGNLIIATEAETLSKNFKNDWGNYSDILRYSFQHEEVSIDRVSMKDDVKIKNPKLSLLISGTPFQLLPFISSRENGLYSRVMFYNFTDFDEWIDDDDEYDDFKKQEIEIEKLNELFVKLYPMVNSVDRNILLSHEQRIKLNATLRETSFYYKNLGLNYDDIIRRLGIILVRIMLIYTILEIKDEFVDKKDEFNLSDKSFDFSLKLFPFLLKSSIETSKIYQGKSDVVNTTLNDTQKQILNVLPSSFNNKEGVEFVTKKLQISDSSVNKALKILKDREFLRKKGALYEKVEKTSS